LAQSRTPQGKSAKSQGAKSQVLTLIQSGSGLWQYYYGLRFSRTDNVGS
jgi:hypothetical protein